ncbi:MAG: TonB-dependent receptor [Rikenellaceae bacterium]
MKKNLLFIMTLLAVTLTVESFAQSKISGKVLGVDKQPIVGATVMVKGTFTGAATNLDGEYSIEATPEQTLVFTFIGYSKQEIVVGSQSDITVTMYEDSATLESVEVVAIGYGTASRRDLTGSVAKADMGEIMKSNVTAFDQALSGRVAGVVVRSGDGELGKESSITIRGNNSLTQSSEPLYVIDGFPMESSMSGLISADDIESIDILKDASATAIYGARGANGVIVITTKKGAEGRPKVAFNASFTIDKLANKIDLMNPYEFVELQSELFTESEMNSSYFSDGRTLEDYKDVEGYDWQDEVYRTAFTQNYSVSVSGGGKSGTRYNVALSALDQEGILLNSSFERYQGKINITQPIGKKVDVSLNANYTNSVTKGTSPTTSNNSSSGSGWLIYSVWGYRPISPDPDSSLLTDLTDFDAASSNDYRFNPVLSTQNEVRNTIVDYFNSNLALNYKITPSLTFRSSAGFTLYNRTREEFNGSMTYTGYAGSPSGKGVNGQVLYTDRRNYLNENTLTYNKRFGKSHNLNALVGLSIQSENYKYHGVGATQMTTESLGLAGLYTGDPTIITPVYQDWTMLSYFTRINYNYQYKYYLTMTMRADGSSKFPSHNRWGYFPSIGASWNFNREDWAKGSKWLSVGKLRASWGQTGNNRTSTPYDYYAQIVNSPGASDSFDYVFDSEIVPGYYVSQMANEDLKWETTTQTNFGIDLGLFDNRIKTTIDWYLKDTKDLLLSATLPSSSGYTEAMMNVGQIRNKGWEFSLETVNISKKDFKWTTSFNIAFNRNEIVKLTGGQNTLLSGVTWDYAFNSQYPYISQVGMPTGMMYGFIYEGTYKTSDFDGSTGSYSLKDGVPYLSSIAQENIQPGDPKYSDINGDGVIDDNDRTIIGSGQPLHTGGFGNTFTYKNFDLNIFFTWSYGNDILNANRLIFEQGLKSNTNQLASYADRWSESNPDSDIPRAGANGMELYSSRVVEDGSFLRLSNISLGYTIPERITQKAKMSSFRIYVTLNNIWTLTSYSGPDPEVSTQNSVLTPGFDWSAYPRTFGATIGANITF